MREKIMAELSVLYPTTPMREVQQWVVRIHDQLQVQEIIEIARCDLPADGVDAVAVNFQAKLRLMIAVPYEGYCNVESTKQFYNNAVVHVSILWAAHLVAPDVMAPFAPCIRALATAMCHIDTQTGGDHLRVQFRPNMEENAREAAYKALDDDRMKFRKLLANSMASLRAWPDACLMYVEFARTIYQMNAYNPPPRYLHDAHKIPLDVKKEVDYFQEILDDIEVFLDNKGEAPPPPPSEPEGEEEESPEEPDIQAETEFLCDKCDEWFRGKLNSYPPPACPKCPGPDDDDER